MVARAGSSGRRYHPHVPRFHHANLGVSPGDIPAMRAFLVDLLGYRPVDVPEELAGFGANWFEGDDGSQIHLSEDPDHRAAARAHVAIVLGDSFSPVIGHLEAAGHPVKVAAGIAGGGQVGLCRDPAGNLWELRQV
jgi:catechol 2,3-dioxygenase-like lactoylglutathione lyase family enzyme